MLSITFLPSLFSVLTSVVLAAATPATYSNRDAAPLFFDPAISSRSILSSVLGSDDSKTNLEKVPESTISGRLLRPALHARAAYCSAASVTGMSCGEPCKALSGVKVLTAGGDDGKIPGYYIAEDPSIQAVVVAHQGTNPTNFLSILNDVKISHTRLNSTLFPNIAGGVEVHDGFQETQGRTADLVLTTVKSALSSTNLKKVLVTGHSLGGAVATLDALMLRMNLPSDVGVEGVAFGLPRVGNQEFADMFDRMVPGFIRVSNQNDPVVRVPPRVLDYRHPSGEFHIQSVDDKSGVPVMVSCPGQENENCAVGDSVFRASVQDHLGPYFQGISFSSQACPA